MCEISKSQRRTYRDQDPPRIIETRGGRASEHQNASGNDDATSSADTDFIGKEHSRCKEPATMAAPSINGETVASLPRLPRDIAGSPGRDNTSAGPRSVEASNSLNTRQDHNFYEKTTAINQVPYNASSYQSACGRNTKVVITNGAKTEESDNCGVLTNGREMAPVMGVPPPPPPAPHMGPDGLVLPRKPYNPCLISNNHKDLRRELLFNQKIGRNPLNQKSELQRALEKQRETAMRKEAERNREETYKDDPRTALQRALEQRARHIQLTEPQIVEPPNPLVNARAKLRTRTDSPLDA